MTHPRTPDDTAPQPIRTRGHLEDGAVGLHAGRLRRAPAGNGPGSDPERGRPAPAPLASGDDDRATGRRSRRKPGHRPRGLAPLAAGENDRAAGRRPARPRRILPLLAAAGAAGLATGLWALARAGRRPAPPLAASLPAAAGSWRWRGHRIATYRRGDGPPVVLVHSIHAAASAHEMSELFRRLAADRTVHAYDLLGFGASDRPPLAYRADLYVDLLGDFLAEAVGEPADVVASSLSGGHALQAACRWPERFRSLVLVNPTGLVTLANGRGPGRRLAEAAFRAPLLGDALFAALVSRPSLAWYDRKAYRDPRLVASLLDHQWATAHQPNARFAPAAFVGNSLAINVARAVRRLAVPALAVWTPPSGFQDTDAESRAFAHLNPHLDTRTIEDCGAVPHEERPADFEAVVREWWEGVGGDVAVVTAPKEPHAPSAEPPAGAPRR